MMPEEVQAYSKPKKMYPDAIYPLADSVNYYEGITKAQLLVLLYTAYLEGKQDAEQEYKYRCFRDIPLR